MKHVWRSVVAVAASGLAGMAFVSPAGAAPGPDTTPAGAVTVHHVDADPAQVAARWTPEAMRAAVPIEQLMPRLDATRSGPVRAAGPEVVPPTAAAVGDVRPAAFPEGGAAWPGGGAIESTAGRVFFTYDGRRASCSGNAVTSGNKSVVLTAGHCVKLEGSWHTDWVFVPGYDNGATPHGTWTARATLATPQWTASEDINYDIGAAVVDPLDGQLLTDVVGGQGVAFNQARGQDMYAFGWPAAAPYDGTEMIYCSGGTFDALISNGIGMTCDMTGGASGGPWFLDFDEATGTGIQNSVNSYKINFISIWMFGPYFGADAQNLYHAAQTS